jgi:acetoin utilization deacetylase AcuC-like enzyme
MSSVPVFLDHSSSLRHDTGSHPEQPERIVAIERELTRRDWVGYRRLSSPAVDRTVLTAVHPERYVGLIEAAADAGGAQLDLDTVVSPGSFEAALHAAGGAVALVDLVLDGEAPCGFSAHRPPGHHAEPSRGMGFCLFNNVAVAARYALDARGLERVMILDWDVHHGNGTNDIFHASRQVLFVSIHQSPLYPGSGPASDVGSGEGAGFTVNLPVRRGSGDEVYCSLVEQVAAPLAREFAPQLILISAGFDAHRDDPLAECEVTDQGFWAMTRAMRRVGDDLAAPVGAVLEGGYALGALARCVAVTMQALAEEAAEPAQREPADRAPTTRVAREAIARLAPWWPELGLG